MKVKEIERERKTLALMNTVALLQLLTKYIRSIKIVLLFSFSKSTPKFRWLTTNSENCFSILKEEEESVVSVKPK